MTNPEPLSNMHVELEALAWAALAKKAEAEKKVRSAQLNQVYREGRTEHVRSPLGDKLGYVNKSDPDPSWYVADQTLVDDHIRQNYPGSVSTVFVVHTPGGSVTVEPEDELFLVLREHAPHLLVADERVDPAAVKALLAESADKGEPAAPGIALSSPSGTVSVNPAKGSFEAVMKLQRAGLLDLESMTRSLPSAAVEDGAA